jgi:hypothetical protein
MRTKLAACLVLVGTVLLSGCCCRRGYSRGPRCEPAPVIVSPETVTPTPMPEYRTGN